VGFPLLDGILAIGLAAVLVLIDDFKDCTVLALLFGTVTYYVRAISFVLIWNGQ
jgi:hypothetical protein